MIDEVGYLPFGCGRGQFVLHRDRQTVRTWQSGVDQQLAIQPVGHELCGQRDTDRCAAGSASAPRAHRPDQRTELSTEGQAEIGSAGAQRNGLITTNRLHAPPG